MNRILQSIAITGVACAACFTTTGALAQDRQRGRPDAAQIQEWQQRRLDSMKDQLEIKDDTEWKALEPLIQKVMDAQRNYMADRLRGAFGRGRGGDRGDRGGDNNTQSDQRTRGGGMFGTPSPETEALQKAVDGKASNSELKAALAKYQEARKEKQAELEKAQADLRKVLSVRQEAVASLAGLL